MHRGSTPTLIIECDRDISDNTGVIVDFSQDQKLIIEKDEKVLNIKGNTIEVYLNEEETLMFKTDDQLNAYVDVQVRIAYGNKRVLSDIVQAIIRPILKDGPMYNKE